MKKKRKFTVSLVVPEGATTKDVEEYIREAVRTMIGCKCPEHPMFEMDRRSVTVKEMR